MQVLSLTESPYGDGEDCFGLQFAESWREERRAYLSTISSLKDLIAKAQVQREAEVLKESTHLHNCMLSVMCVIV